MNQESKIFVAGHNGLVGSAILRALTSKGYNNVVTRRHPDVDLTNQSAVNEFFEQERPEYVFLAAAKVGGIFANSTYPAEFIYNNLMIGINIVEASKKYGVKKLLNLGSSCIYPRLSPQPMKEEYLLTSALEPTNEAYAVAKISIIKLCKYYNQQYGTNFISAMPTNQYGRNDNFSMETAHLLPMVVRRFHLAKLLQNRDFDSIQKDLKENPIGYGLDGCINKENLEQVLNRIGVFENKVVVWGDGTAYRELMHSDDLGDACVFLMENCNYSDIGELVNITSGTDILLKDLFELVKKIVNYTGLIEYDTSKPNGMPKKLMDATKINKLGWKPKISLKEGIKDFYEGYINGKY